MVSISSLVGRFNRLRTWLVAGIQPSIVGYLQKQTRGVSTVVWDEGFSAGNKWDALRLEIRNEFDSDPMGFLRQPTISRAVHPNEQEIASSYLNELSQDDFACQNILSRLCDVPIGDPYRCETFPLASPMSVQHVWYMYLMNRYLGIFLPTSGLKHVLELGGGYGNFCRLAYSFGYSGKYVIADLPEMHSIQRHFLSHALPCCINNKFVKFASLGEAEMLPEQGPSLLIATFSLSEMPLETRREIEGLYDRFNYIFIAYNRSFDSVDNVQYFEELRMKLSHNFEINLIKDDYRPSWFMFGMRKV